MELKPWYAPQTQIPGAQNWNRYGPGSAPQPAAPGAPIASAPGPVAPVSITASQWYANLIEGSANVGNGVSGIFLAAPGMWRNYLGIRNSSATANIYVGFGINASPASWLILTPGQIVVFDSVVPQNDLYAYADAANGTISYAYSTTTR